MCVLANVAATPLDAIFSRIGWCALFARLQGQTILTLRACVPLGAADMTYALAFAARPDLGVE